MRVGHPLTTFGIVSLALAIPTVGDGVKVVQVRVIDYVIQGKVRSCVIKCNTETAVAVASVSCGEKCVI